MLNTSNILTENDMLMWFGDVYSPEKSKDVLDYCANAASKAIESFCSRSFVSNNFTDKIFISNTNEILLSNYPVISVESLTYVVGSATYNYSADDFYVDSSIGVLRLFHKYFHEKSVVHVAYTAGYTHENMPDDLKLACLMQAAYYGKSFGSAGELGLYSYGKMDEQTTKDKKLSENGILSEVVAIVEAYKRFDYGTVDTYPEAF